MRFFRKRSANRAIALICLIVFLQSTVSPYYALALTGGPHQTEYTSYEAPGSTDMVNLMTGDFTFSLPLLQVPGPEGSFSLPLTYNAGIGLDQEASWVGLGWTMNPGSLIRNINGFPDDADGQAQVVNVKDLTIFHELNTKIFGVGNYGWNSQQGRYGNISLLGLVNMSWNQNTTSVGLMGYNYSMGQNSGFSMNPFQFISGVSTVITLGSASIVTENGKQLFKAAALAKAAGTDALTGVAISAVGSLFDSGSPVPTDGYWEYSRSKKNIFFGLGSTRVQSTWLDQTRVEDMYGTLFLGNAPTQQYSDLGPGLDLSLNNNGPQTLNRFAKTSGTANQGAASDISYQNFGDPDEYHMINSPVFLASDKFNVNVAGISGSISPYRLEVGSVAMPREMTSNHQRLTPVSYLSNEPPYASSSYKVPFIYEGQANGYFHHVGGQNEVSSPVPHFGVSNSLTSTTLTYELNDVSLNTQRINSNISAIKRIPQGNYVEWLSNAEIRATRTYASKYIDFLDAGSGPGVGTESDRYKFRTKPISDAFATSHSSAFNNTAIPVNSGFIDYLSQGTVVDIYISFYTTNDNLSNGISSEYVEFPGQTINSVVNSSSTGTYTFAVNNSQLQLHNGKIADIEVKIVSTPGGPYGLGGPNSLGAFCITAADGSTYHFALPQYEYDQYTYVKQVNDENKNSTIKRPDPFANNWLLTAITGADFIDRNSNGLADPEDWGYWVKLNYGLHSSSYKWRLPFSGFRRSSNNLTDSYSKGKTQKIYLNTIETRSHVALFKKSTREDGKDEDLTVSPLRLDEIILMSREHYDKLTGQLSEDGYGVQDFSNKLAFILDGNSLSSDANAFIEKNALKRIGFTYDYLLCPGTLNSTASGNRKLTLIGISLKGRYNLNIVPDYKFEYGFNPDYSQNNWDGYGMYNPQGGGNGHDTPQSNADLNGSAWSLSKIITPLGAEISVNYERDDFSKVLNEPMYVGAASYDNWNTNVVSSEITTLNFDNSDGNGGLILNPGDRVKITGEVHYWCNYNGSGPHGKAIDVAENVVADAAPTYVTFTQPYMFLDQCDTQYGSINIERYFGNIQRILDWKKGDGIRVASIISRNEFGEENKIRYLYKNANGTSSGVLSKAPEYINVNGANPSIFGYPTLPVIYGMVTVLNGKLSDDNDFYSKYVYQFETPSAGHYVIESNPIKLNEQVGTTYTDDIPYRDFLTLFEWQVVDKTSRIGALKSIQVFEKDNSTPVSVTNLEYVEEMLNSGVNNYQGIYSSGVLMFERIRAGLDFYNKANRTTILQYPYALKRTVHTKDGFVSEAENLSWDQITGIVDQKMAKSSLGVYVKTVLVPAYSDPAYSELRSKAFDQNNKNMLSQVAATYTFRSNAAGENLGLMSATAQTWKSDWVNYRLYNSATQAYNDGADGEAVWRKGAVYTWKGEYNKCQDDGTQIFFESDKFSFASGASNPLWLYAGEILRFDHFGMPLQTMDMSQIASSTKMGYGDETIIARASNAAYNEIAFSSAEDIYVDKPFFGGEVGLGTGTVITNSAHTGEAAVSVSSGKSFVFKTSGLKANKKYRGSVWANNGNGKIYYNINSSGNVVPPNQTISPAVNGWYRLDVMLPIQTSDFSLEVGVLSGNGTEIYFDDFRFQPVEATMTCFVYPPSDFEFTETEQQNGFSYVLDNQNMYTKYEHNSRGQLIKTYQESFTNGVKLVSERKDNYRRFHVNQ